MALQARPKFDNPRQFANDALRKASVDFNAVMRVYPPEDTGDTCEVLYLDSLGRPFTAWVEPSGKVAATFAGW